MDKKTIGICSLIGFAISVSLTHVISEIWRKKQQEKEWQAIKEATEQLQKNIYKVSINVEYI